MSRTRWRLGLSATAFLVAAGLVPAPAHAEDVTDYAITVDPAAKGAKIDDTMYGVFFEDINRAADGGLYAELVQNRSFEYSTADNTSYTPLTSWAVDGTAQVVDDAGRLNERNRNYLSLGAGSSVTNAGYNTGIPLEQGKKYDFSLWARAARGTALAVTLQDADGPLAAARKVTVRKDGWAKYTATFTATRTSSDGRLTVASAAAAALDMVSLFPRDTYKHQPNGLRKDLAEKVEALHPGFLRFPAAAWSTPAPWRTTARPRTGSASGPTSGRTPSARSRSAPPTPTSGATTRVTASATTSTSASPRTSARCPCPSSRPW